MAAKRCLTEYGCYTHWWMALPALPAERDTLDWWARPDGRCTPYRRLKRLWFDYTRMLKPAGDPSRPDEFAKLTHSTQMIPRAWENLVLLHPSQWLPRLLRAATLPCPSVDDCCWSYEFEAMVGRTARYKQVDITIHARGSEGDMLVVVEAKRPGDKLKEDCDLPDTEPVSYLDLDAFRHVDRRFLIYLVEDAYVPVVRSGDSPCRQPWRRRRYDGGSVRPDLWCLLRTLWNPPEVAREIGPARCN